MVSADPDENVLGRLGMTQDLSYQSDAVLRSVQCNYGDVGQKYPPR